MLRLSFEHSYGGAAKEQGHSKEWEKREELPAWRLTKIKSNREVVKDAQKDERTVHFAPLTDICHLSEKTIQAHLLHSQSKVRLHHK